MADDPKIENRTKSWNIVDGKLPSGLRDNMRAKIDEHSQIVYPDPMVAPWLQYPEGFVAQMG